MDLYSILGFKFVAKRLKIVVLFNGLFFGGVFVTLVLANTLLRPSLYTGWRPTIPGIFLNSGWLGVLLGIFIFNFAVNCVLLITLPGIVFFPLSAGLLLYRAFSWGIVLYGFPDLLLLVALPVLLFEGEAYVFAATTGTVIGASWLISRWLGNNLQLPRREIFKTVSIESLPICTLTLVLLIVASTAQLLIMQFAF